MDDYLSARMITTPFGLYDCDVPCDGSVAIIVSREDVAADMTQKPVLVEAVGTQITERCQLGPGHARPRAAGDRAGRAPLDPHRPAPADVDIALLYDGFTFNCLSWIEALGFCGWGEAKDFLDGGNSIALDGKLPLNTHGGQLSAGRLHGYGFIHEAVMQLRGEAGERQVADAEIAVVSTGGGTPGGASSSPPRVEFVDGVGLRRYSRLKRSRRAAAGPRVAPSLARCARTNSNGSPVQSVCAFAPRARRARRREARLPGSPVSPAAKLVRTMNTG